MEREVKRAFVENKITQEIAIELLKDSTCQIPIKNIASATKLSEIEVENLKRKIDKGKL